MRLSKKKTELLLSLDLNNKSYFDHFCEFWLPIYRYQVNEAKLEDNKNALSEIMLNLVKNIHLSESEKRYIAKRIGIYYLIEAKENKLLSDNVRNDLFKQHEKLIYLILKRYKLLSQREELYDVGLIGLTKAMNTYDLKKGYKESTYFYNCIANEIKQYLHSQSMLKRKCTEPIISLDKEITEDQNTLSNLFPDETQNVEKEILLKEQKDILNRALKKLKSDWRFVIEKEFGLYNQKEYKKVEIAKKLGISKTAVGNKEKSALKKLREILEKDFNYD
ncbi:MAG: sigma-70 family RNA polymerase sigma factor [Bacilli bacterium]|nr:sigma-70 family RNA polymerase sigma factor [Bacilli bacterium]